MAIVASFDPLRSLGHASISGSYATVGSVTTVPARIMCITNNTDGDMLVSTDGATDMLFVAKSSYKTFDFTTNRLETDTGFAIPSNTQFYVKQSTAPTTGAIYIELIEGVVKPG